MATAAQMRQASSEIMTEVYDLMRTQSNIGERYGWDDARVNRIQRDIDRFTRQANTLRRKARITRATSAA